MTTLEDLDVLDCRRYARHLKQRARGSDLKASTATTYYAYVRAFLTFYVADELLESNPAKAKRATDELPEDLGDADRQFWREEEWRAIMRYADERVDQALDGDADITREQLADEGVPDGEIETMLENTDIETVLHEHNVVPPALSTNGARNLMKRLCEDADLDVDGDYLKPHGARRGLGHELYANGHAELAQSALRHTSIETTHKSYSDIKAAETAQQVDDVLERGNPDSRD